MTEDTDEDLFHTWIHPVLDLSHVSMSKDLYVNEEALNRYLRAALAERDNQILHDAAEKQRAYQLTQGYDPNCICGGCGWCTAQELTDLIHPVCDGECDYTPNSEEYIPVARASRFGIAKETTFGTPVTPTTLLPGIDTDGDYDNR